MHAISTPLTRAGLLAALLLSLALPGAVQADDDLGPLADTLYVPDGATREDCKEVVAYSLAARGWTVRERTDERVIGYLKHRGNEAIATFILRDDTIEFYCLGYAIDKNGNRKKPEQPRGWIGNLTRDINKRLGMRAATK